jgi:hypothetical protein
MMAMHDGVFKLKSKLREGTEGMAILPRQTCVMARSSGEAGHRIPLSASRMRDIRTGIRRIRRVSPSAKTDRLTTSVRAADPGFRESRHAGMTKRCRLDNARRQRRPGTLTKTHAERQKRRPCQSCQAPWHVTGSAET